jgi:hypothetical protein
MTPATTPVLPPRDGFLRAADPFMPYRTITCQFQALLTTFLGLLFSFRSRYYCAIGFEEYLVLEVDDPQLPARIPTHGTQATPWPHVLTRTGLSPSVARRSRPLPLRSVYRSGRLTTPHLPCGIRFELRRFRSPLLTTSRLISLPPPTEMFQFGGFPILTDHRRSDRKSHSGISGS